MSFGYPACPNLAEQVTLFRLLEPESFGLSLTEGFVMDMGGSGRPSTPRSSSPLETRGPEPVFRLGPAAVS